MGLVFFVLFVLFVLPTIMGAVAKYFAAKKPIDNKTGTFATVIRKEKKCPPHKWFSQEIRDTAGNKLGDRLVCADCGPLKSQGENYE